MSLSRELLRDVSSIVITANLSDFASVGYFVEGKPQYIVSDPEILGGTPAFRGTRVPFSFLIEYLEKGHTIEQFIQDYPSVTLDLATKALEEASSLMQSYAYAHPA